MFVKNMFIISQNMLFKSKTHLSYPKEPSLSKQATNQASNSASQQEGRQAGREASKQGGIAPLRTGQLRSARPIRVPDSCAAHGQYSSVQKSGFLP